MAAGGHASATDTIVIRRRQLLLAVPLLAWARVASAQVHPLDAIPVYLVPLDDFPEDLAEALAKSLHQDLKVRIKASLRLPPLRINKLPGTEQLIAEEVLLQGNQASARLPNATSTTYRVFLTLRDINSRSANFRFQFSSHNRTLNSSVISMARLVEYVDERPRMTQRSVSRLLKLTKRAIGEMYLGWSRSPDPNDIMFAPLMGLDDLDRLGNDHSEEPDSQEPSQTPVPQVPSNKA
jgi:predicted Zn-dependent protease